MEDHDPKVVAAEARKFPETEKVLRQFLSLESGNYATAAYRKGYDILKGEKHPLKENLRCKHDGYVAETLEDLEWHEDQCGHDPDHDFEPVKP